MPDSAVDNLGPQLLMRLPSPYDHRDYRLETFMSDDPLDQALASTLKSWLVPSSQKNLNKRMVQILKSLRPTPTPTPTPDPSTIPNWWDEDDPILDQGQTGHCVGYTGADMMNALPFDNHVNNDKGHEVYYLCKEKDGEPREENGSYVRTLMLVLRDLGIIKTYASTMNVDSVKKFVTNPNGGPLALGIGWTDKMFYPDSDGRVHPDGEDVGGHAIMESYYDPDSDKHWIVNHWGKEWGYNGMFYLTSPDLANRLANDGECWAAVQVA
jgi:hypothetical protein